MAELTVEDVAERLSLSPRRVTELLRTGRLRGHKAYRGARRWLIPEEEVSGSHGKMPKGTPSGTDPELGPHGRELLEFGQRFRDLVYVPEPCHGRAVSRVQGQLWQSGPGPNYSTVDLRKEPLWPGFPQHLSAHTELWKCLGDMENAFDQYSEAWRQTYEAVYEAVSQRAEAAVLPDAPAEVFNTIAQALLAEGFSDQQRGRAWFDLRKEEQSDGVHWALHMGSWFCQVNSAAEADTLAWAYRELRQSLLQNRDLGALIAARRGAEQAIGQFRASLTPDALLRKLVQNGHCDWCP